MYKVILILLISTYSFSQVGIGTTTPKSSLDINISDAANPSNTDGLLIPRIDIFPTVDPSIDQQGMLVYLTTITGSNLPGFYYWNNLTSNWINIESDNLGNHTATTNLKLNGNWLSNDGDTEGIYIDTNGNVGVNVSNPSQKFEVNRDQNESAILGRAQIGFMGYNDWAGFSHFDRASTGNYALLQHSSGITILNAASGQDILFRINNDPKAILDQDGNFGIGTITPGSPLDVKTTSTSTEAALFRLTSSVNRSMSILQPDISNNNDPFTFFTNNAFEFRVDSNNSLTLGPRGLVGVNTTNPTEELHVTGTIRMVDGNQQNGYILSSDANGIASWTDPSSLVGSTFSVTNNVVLPNTSFVDETVDDFVFGATQLDDDTDVNHDNRFFFDKSKAAFRAGQVDGTDWDDSKRGSFSFAAGYNTEASGDYSTATGRLGNATGDYSTAMGNGCTASGSFSMGWGTYSEAIGTISTAWGAYSDADGAYSTAGGYNVKANSGYETAIGRYNTDNTPNSATGWNTSDKIFVIGNGTGNTSSSRSNAFIVFKNGNATLAGTLSQSSDRTLKTNINPLKNSLNNILQLNGYTYNWKETGNRDKELQIGVIAQEVEALYPELVHKDSKGKLTVNYSGLVPVLIEATKEQQKELDKMKTQMQLMLQEINKLKENK